MNEYYQWYKQHHICVDCKTNEVAKGKAKCFGCLQNDAERKRKERETAEYQEKKKNQPKEQNNLEKIELKTVYVYVAENVKQKQIKILAHTVQRKDEMK